MSNEIDAAVERIRVAALNAHPWTAEKILREAIASAEQRGAAAAHEYRDETFDGLRERANEAEARLRDAAKRAREIVEKLDRLDRDGGFIHVDAPIWLVSRAAMATVRDFLRELAEEK